MTYCINQQLRFITTDGMEYACKFVGKHTNVSSKVCFEDGTILTVLNSMLKEQV